MIGEGKKDLAELIREIVKTELARRQVAGRGGDTLITSEQDIHLVTKGSHKVYANGAQVLTGAGGGGVTGSGSANTVAKWSSASVLTNSMILDDGVSTIQLQKSGVAVLLNFYNSLTLRGQIFAMTGLSDGDFQINAVSGNLVLSSISGVSVQDELKMNSNKITGLAAGTTSGDAVRYEQALLLAGGTMTGDLIMNGADIKLSGTTPSIYMRNTTFAPDTYYETITFDTAGILNLRGAVLGHDANVYILAKSDLVMDTGTYIRPVSGNIEIQSGGASGNTIRLNAYGDIALDPNSGYYTICSAAGVKPAGDDTQNLGVSGYIWKRGYINYMISADAAKGLVLKDTDGHYWRIYPDTAGALQTSDLGTGLPS